MSSENRPIELDDPRAQAAAALAQRMIDTGVLDFAGWERARTVSAQSGERLDQVLVKLGLAPESALVEAFAAATGAHLLGAEAFDVPPVDLAEVRVDFLRANLVAPVRYDGEVLLIAVADPFDPFAADALGAALGAPHVVGVAAPSDIRAFIERAFGRAAGSVSDVAPGALEEDVERLKDLASEEPVIRLVNDLIDAALGAGASDLHLEPEADRLRVRLRVDGMLRDLRELSLAESKAAISRLKIMARLDIAETRLPQDGRIRTSARGREIDLRLSTLPSIHGEAAALRLLDGGDGRPGLDALGLPIAEQDRLRSILASPSGVLLVTGPTGSGKTTTLYAALAELATRTPKILTVEDPVEYRLPRAVQVQVKPEIGLDFASSLRSFLRHDPDVIMVGEIRDKATAEIAIQAALTGHFVLSTLHTNSAIGALPRLRDMGVESYLLGATISGLVSQRLLRRLCDACKTPIGADAAAAAGVTAYEGDQFFSPAGCARCGQTGYRGRLAAIEVIAVDANMRRLIGEGVPAEEIEHLARASGAASLGVNATTLAAQGLTSIEEVVRVAREKD